MNPSFHPSTLDHAKDAYTNAQENIRFMDAKAGALTGLLTLATGLPMWLLQWLTDSGGEKASLWHVASVTDLSVYVLTAVFVLWGAGVMSGVISLWLILDCILARSPSSKRRALVLYPFVKGRRCCFAIARKLTTGMTEADVIREYCNQILRLGLIQFQKSKKLRRAMTWFRIQIAAYGLGTLGLMQVYLYQIS
jgi:hypothetical protein